MRTVRSDLFVLAAIMTSALVVITGKVEAFWQQQNSALHTRRYSQLILDGTGVDFLLRIRGGSSAIDVEIESSDEDETDDEEEEAPELAKATKKAVTKAVKKSVAAAMKSPSKKSNIFRFLKLPYIVKACLNPVVLFQMTAGYWKSLYNIDYMTEKAVDSSQGLRSALEQKARQGGSGKKSSRGKRKMKPGQAKTLSDLPQLNT